MQMAGRREANPPEVTSLSPGQVEKAVNAIYYLSSLGLTTPAPGGDVGSSRSGSSLGGSSEGRGGSSEGRGGSSGGGSSWRGSSGSGSSGGGSSWRGSSGGGSSNRSGSSASEGESGSGTEVVVVRLVNHHNCA